MPTPRLNFIRKLLLRGRLRSWWIQRKTNQIESAYLKALTVERERPPKAVGHAPLDRPRLEAKIRRILFIGDCMWEAEQLFPEIRKICHLDVLDLRKVLSGAPNPRQAVVAEIEAHAKASREAEPDLILFYLRPSLLSEEAFDVIRKRWSCPLLGMNLDDRVEFFPYGILRSGNDDYARWIQSFDVNLTSSLTAVDWYRARGAEVRHLPQGFCPDPRFLHAPVEADFAHSLSFVGSWKPERGDLIARLNEHGIHPTIFGSGWPNSRWADDAPAVFRGSQLNLGIGYALASARIANAKGRDIECPAVGACYLTTYHWELSQLFEIGKEVLCYRNAEELIELIGFYGRRPEACLAIARAAHKRAHREHTWELRLRSLFRDLGFKPALHPQNPSTAQSE